MTNHLAGGNPIVYLYPEMLDELLKFIFMPGRLEQGCRDHLAAVKGDPSKRP